MIWSIVGVVIVAAILYAIVSRERHLAGPHNLGSVSEQWIAQYRAHQPANRSG